MPRLGLGFVLPLLLGSAFTPSQYHKRKITTTQRQDSKIAVEKNLKYGLGNSGFDTVMVGIPLGRLSQPASRAVLTSMRSHQIFIGSSLELANFCVRHDSPEQYWSATAPIFRAKKCFSMRVGSERFSGGLSHATKWFYLMYALWACAHYMKWCLEGQTICWASDAVSGVKSDAMS